jgi:hypothetical protein
MKNLFTILILFSALNCSSQNFAPPGATWYHYYVLFGSSEGYVNLSYAGDTTILGIQSQKISKTYNYVAFQTGEIDESFWGYEYTYADQDHVYQLIGDEFKILYDFTVQTGDTILVHYHYDFPVPEECDSIGRAKVNETGIEIINDMELRWYTIETFENSPAVLNGKIIERVGNSTGYIFSQPANCVFFSEQFGGPFRCYSDNEFPEYKNPSYDNPCDYITDIEEVGIKNFFNIYPNPADEVINISMSDNIKLEKVRVYNVAGMVVLNQSPQPPSPRGSQITLDVSGLVPGMYLLEVETTDGIMEVKRLIVE